MLVEINGYLLNISHIDDVIPINRDNPKYVPDIKTDNHDIKGNGELPVLEAGIEILYQSGIIRKYKIGYSDLIKIMKKKRVI
jgi:hypothetical protein